MNNLSVIYELFGKPVTGVVKPVTESAGVTVAVYLKEINPEVNVLGLDNFILVVVLSHWIVLTGIVKTLGVGLTATVTVICEPTQNVVPGPVGMILKITCITESAKFVNLPLMTSPTAEPVNGNLDVIPDGLIYEYVNVVPVTPLAVPNTIVWKGTPGHSACDEGVAVAIGILLTVRSAELDVF